MTYISAYASPICPSYILHAFLFLFVSDRWEAGKMRGGLMMVLYPVH